VFPDLVDIDFRSLAQEAEDTNPCYTIEEDLDALAVFLESISEPAESSLATPREPSHQASNRNSKRRNLKRRNDGSIPDALPSKRILQHVFNAASSIETNSNMADIKAAEGGNTGRKGKFAELGDKGEREKEYTVKELVGMGFKHVKWDGV
jgi:hypothetical protein